LQSQDDPFPKTHDVEESVAQAAKLHGDFTQFAKAAAVLTPYVSAFRYPGGGSDEPMPYRPRNARTTDPPDSTSNRSVTVTVDIAKTEQKRLLSLLEIVQRAGSMLLKTDARLFKASDACARITSEEDPIHAQGF
jgi:hypothetical protein